MYFLIIEAHPKPDHASYGIVEGAYVSLFVNAVSAAVAERNARDLIADTHFRRTLVLRVAYDVDATDGHPPSLRSGTRPPLNDELLGG